GPPQAVYDRPANAFVAQFIGSPPMNLLPPHRLGGPGPLVGVRPAPVRPGDDGTLGGQGTGVEALGHERPRTMTPADGTPRRARGGGGGGGRGPGARRRRPRPHRR